MRSTETIFGVFICFTLLSCKKSAVHKDYPEFIGKWKHIENSNEKWYIEIGESSWGTITLYDSLGEFITPAYGENPRRWLYNPEKKILQNGLIGGKFAVDTYPEVATSDFVMNMDSVFEGDSYMVLRGDCFIKM